MASSGLTRARPQQWLIAFGYDGARFCGLQPQAGKITAGGTLLQRVQAAGGVAPYAVSWAARTDAGVHAVRNVVSLRLADATCLQAVDAARDDGLRDVQVLHLPRRVMARAMTAGKHYVYRIGPGPAAWQVPGNLDLDLDIGAMQQAAAALSGTHDFSAFRHAGCEAKNPVKTVQVRVQPQAHGVQVHMHGDNFLRKMVRIMVGTLVEVGQGARPASSMSHVLQSKTRAQAGCTAPGHGLTLQHIHWAEPWTALLRPALEDFSS